MHVAPALRWRQTCTECPEPFIEVLVVRSHQAQWDRRFLRIWRSRPSGDNSALKARFSVAVAAGKMSAESPPSPLSFRRCLLDSYDATVAGYKGRWGDVCALSACTLVDIVFEKGVGADAGQLHALVTPTTRARPRRDACSTAPASRPTSHLLICAVITNEHGISGYRSVRRSSGHGLAVSLRTPVRDRAAWSAGRSPRVPSGPLDNHCRRGGLRDR